MERGDIDDFGNIFFLHPYCGFCKNYFFDEDEFKRHMNVEHITCNVCGSQHKYVYYKDYDSLETHYKISHYICSDLNCLAKKFIAFRNAEELKIHRTEAHSAGNKKYIINYIESTVNSSVDLTMEELSLNKSSRSRTRKVLICMISFCH